MKLEKSYRKGKRYMIKRNGKTIHFGAYPFKKGTFIDHKDQRIKNAWIARHRGDKNWDVPWSAIWLSRHLLWGDSDNLKENIKSLDKHD